MKYRVGGSLELAIKNLSRFQAAKERLRANTPKLRWQYLVHKHNEEQVELAKQIARERNITLYFRPMTSLPDRSWESFLHEKARSGRFNHEEWTFDAVEDFPKRFQPWKPKSGAVRPRKDPALLKLPKGLPGACVLAFDRMIIHWDGHVVPCCSCFGSQFFLGNLLESSMEEIWNSQKMQKCRKFLRQYGSSERVGSVCEHSGCALTVKYPKAVPARPAGAL